MRRTKENGLRVVKRRCTVRVQAADILCWGLDVRPSSAVWWGPLENEQGR